MVKVRHIYFSFMLHIACQTHRERYFILGDYFIGNFILGGYVDLLVVNTYLKRRMPANWGFSFVVAHRMKT